MTAGVPPTAQMPAVTGLNPMVTPVTADSIFTANSVHIPQAAEKRSERKNLLLLSIEKSIMIPDTISRPKRYLQLKSMVGSTPVIRMTYIVLTVSLL